MVGVHDGRCHGRSYSRFGLPCPLDDGKKFWMAALPREKGMEAGPTQNPIGQCGTPCDAVPIAEIERATGLTRDVVRKWESRYGFPRPARDENGDRVYPPDQVARLQLIRRLLGAGMRPGKIVGLDQANLELLIDQLAPVSVAAPSDCCQPFLAALSRQDMSLVTQILKGQLIRQGLSRFVRETVSLLNIAVGEAWLRRDIRVFEEHLYSEAVRDILHDAIRTISVPSGSPRVLLSTAPGELHTIGLLMADAVLSLEGCCCVRLGPQTPLAEIVAAVTACRVDVVGLSFSIAHPVREVAQFLYDLRDRLGPSVEIWAGGAGISRQPMMKGVRIITDLGQIGPRVNAWKAPTDIADRGGRRAVRQTEQESSRICQMGRVRAAGACSVGGVNGG